MESDFWPVSFKGLRATCTAHLNDSTRGTILLSLVGSATVLNGLWAAFLSNETLSLLDGTTVRRIPRVEDDPHIKTLAHRQASDYRTLRSRLKGTGKRQLVLVHQQATQACAMDQPFFVLAENEPAPLARFYTQFTRAVPVCGRSVWSGFLWEQGLVQHLIGPCDGRGMNMWRVDANGEAWADIVREGIAAHAIQ